MKIYTLIVAFFFISTTTFVAQENTIEDTSLNGQFDKIYRTSTSYQTYKVIGKERFLQLKQNVLDSLAASKKTIKEKNKQLSEKENIIQSTQEVLTKTKTDLDNALKKENSISLFGMQLSKLTYNLILWTIVLLLLLALAYFIFRFTRSNVLTKKAEGNLTYVEQEFEQHRKKSLEREQKLRRQLQDEINKQRNI
ncbi:hypothetical protein [Polaribacter sp.]|uniref:hypothetical protein n=1 Tax=Polaribacter sp. TaxID=1920175 RepID=UPI003F6B67BE